MVRKHTVYEQFFFFTLLVLTYGLGYGLPWWISWAFEKNVFFPLLGDLVMFDSVVEFLYTPVCFLLMVLIDSQLMDSEIE